MTNEEITVKLAEHSNRIKVSEKRIEDLEAETKNIHQLTTSVEKLAMAIDSQSKQIEKQSEKIDNLEQSKFSSIQYWLRIIVGAVCTGFIGYIIGFLMTR